ncbi:MAG: hypothetical protein KAX50_07425 [Saprospiraceae bacterium]|nr:hypothetical protein [Saprospiraceae bacterium]
MKKSILLSALFGVFFLSLSGQPAQGTWMLGGDARFQSNIGGGISTLTLSPRAGYFVTDRLALGMGSGLFAGRTDFVNYSGVSVSPFARYYFPLKKTKLSLLLETGGSFDAFRFNGETSNTWRIQAGGGINYFLTPEFALEAMLGAGRVFPKIGEDFTETDFRIGFQVFLPRKDREADASFSSGALRKGSILLGVARTLTLNSGNQRFEPTFSYMLSDRFAVGAAITLPINEFRPHLRYFADSENASKLRPFLGAGSSFIWKYDESDWFNITPFAEAGLLYFINPNLALEGALQYQADFRAFRPASDAVSNIMARVGFQYVLPSKR